MKKQLLLLAALLLTLTACTPAPPLSEEDLAALHEAYGYWDRTVEWLDEPYMEFDEMEDLSAVVRVKVTGERSNYKLPVTIEEVLWAKEDFTHDDEIILRFVYSESSQKAWNVDNEYVCIIPARFDGGAYKCGVFGSFFLVDGYLLTMTEQPGLTTKYDGYSLEAFRQALSEELPSEPYKAWKNAQ